MFLQLVLFGVLILLVFKWNQRDSQLPPGEWGLPIVGILPYSRGGLRKYFNKVKHKYGNIFSMRIGTRTAVFLRDYETIKHHLNKTELSARADLYSFSAFNFFRDLGIVFTSGPIWQSNRRFTLRHLRDFGLGKSNQMEVIILRETANIVKDLESKLGEPNEVENTINIAVANVVWELVAGTRLDPNSPKMIAFSKALTEDVAALDGPIYLLDFFPSLIPICPTFIKNKWMKLDQFMKNRGSSHKFLEEIVDDHKRTLDPSNPRDYIDAYLIEIEEKKEITVFFEDPIANLVSNIHNLFNASMDTTAVTMKWFILYMAAHPHIQERIHKELDSVLTMDQLPLLEHKNSLPYLQAVIYEMMRHRTIIPFSIAHTTQNDYHMQGYKIPKGALIYPCLDECHRDPHYWEKPEEFYPGHFLDENGDFKMKTESFIPFSYGKRICLGESVAKMEIFLFTAAIMQSFNISLPKGAEVNLNPDESIFIVAYPHPYKVIFEKRLSK